MIPPDTVWFWWPVAFAIITGSVATHITQVARRNSRTPGKPVGLGAIAVLSVAIPIVPLTIGFGAACSDTGLAANMNLYGILAGFPALVLWTAVLWRLYVAAGGDPGYVERYPLIIFFASIAGMVLEFVFSMQSISVYCEGSWSAARLHLITAGLCAVGAGCVVSALMHLADRRAKSATAAAPGNL